MAPLRILIVDDSDTVRRILHSMLYSEEWVICGEAADGASGINLFKKLQPDAVVLDLAMPDCNGLDVAKEMSKLDSTVPIVLFTIVELENLERPAREAGISAIVPKTQAWRLVKTLESIAHRGYNPQVH